MSLVFTLALAQWVISLLAVAFLFCSVLLILTVLIQKPQGGGLSGAFGAGGGSGETAFGARTGDALTMATIAFFVIWLLVAISLVYATRPSTADLQLPTAAGIGDEQPPPREADGPAALPPREQPAPEERPADEPPAEESAEPLPEDSGEDDGGQEGSAGPDLDDGAG